MQISLGQGDFYQYICLFLLSDSEMIISIKVDMMQDYKSLQYCFNLKRAQDSSQQDRHQSFIKFGAEGFVGPRKN